MTKLNSRIRFQFKNDFIIKKLLLFLILSFFSTQGFSASCPDGSEPTKTASDDGSYYVYKFAIEENLPEIVDEKGYVIVLKEDFSKPFKYKKIKKNIYKYEYLNLFTKLTY